MTTDVTTIPIWQASGCGLILLVKSGVVYYHQAGGMSCLHPEAEGAYVPLPRVLYSDVPHVGCWGEALDPSEMDEMEAFFAVHTPYLQLDRARSGESTEAWIYVNVLPYQVGVRDSVLGNYVGPAIFLFENCD